MIVSQGSLCQISEIIVAKFEPYQRVKVVRVVSPKHNFLSGIGGTRSPRVGDVGCIVDIYSKPHEAYCVECVRPDGGSDWLADFLPEELDLV